MRELLLAGAVAAAAILTAAASQAETLHLVCHVEWVKPGAHRAGLRRIDIDTDTRVARFTDDEGQGWRLRGERPIVSIDSSRIVLEAGGGRESSIDRLTGQYQFHNSADGVTIHGPCQKTGPERRRF